ncbi:MAG: 50S ribosomal protein L34e [Candidatus Micrarchaeota archaeon]|nr:50S ribosomal protein L34e [Candidatus Micrarchaeota archaeon]MDE1847428.1 50S ribosomal protein L34e [Candidatus Micrarchaeota archaeon]MDE1864077.1 50S ribosomal protein L34e [Candidatus Micrarchaeota archaeon]
MPRPMYRSRSYRRLSRVTPSKRHTIHYARRKNSFPHCAICKAELNGISISKTAKGKSLKSNSRKFGGVLCSSCTGEVIKLASRIENGEMKINSIGIRQKQYVLQMIAH